MVLQNGDYVVRESKNKYYRIEHNVFNNLDELSIKLTIKYCKNSANQNET